ncbi:MAG: hypothetical protein K8E66_10760 [Phycisphaerales bacterium]|nr:hypothetical protein [Phycisphaerales bacterium]
MKRFVLIAIAAAIVSPAWSQGPPGQPPMHADLPGPEQVAEHLTARLDQIDELRAHIAEIIGKIEAGESPENALGPMGMRMMQRRTGEDPGGPGGPGGPDGPGGVWGLLRDAPGTHSQAGPQIDLSSKEVRAFIDSHLPELAARLVETEADDPERAERMVQRMTPRLADIIRWEKSDPEFVQLRVEEMRVGMEILGKARGLCRLTESKAAEADLDKARREVRSLLGRQFDLRNRLEAHRLDRMMVDLEVARAKLAERSGRRNEILDEHMSRVLDRTMRAPGEERGPRFGHGPRGQERD